MRIKWKMQAKYKENLWLVFGFHTHTQGKLALTVARDECFGTMKGNDIVVERVKIGGWHCHRVAFKIDLRDQTKPKTNAIHHKSNETANLKCANICEVEFWLEKCKTVDSFTYIEFKLSQTKIFTCFFLHPLCNLVENCIPI